MTQAMRDVRRVDVTPAAVSMLATLAERHGPLLLHQSGGCCDGSAPMCYLQSDFEVGPSDVRLGIVAPDVAGGVPVYIGAQQFAYWSHTHLTIDLVPGRGSGFSLEAPEGFRFLTRSRLFSDAEADELDRLGPPPRGAATVAEVFAREDTAGQPDWNRHATPAQMAELRTLGAQLGEDVPQGMRYAEAAAQLESFRRRTRRRPAVADVPLPG